MRSRREDYLVLMVIIGAIYDNPESDMIHRYKFSEGFEIQAESRRNAFYCHFNSVNVFRATLAAKEFNGLRHPSWSTLNRFKTSACCCLISRRNKQV